MSEQTPEIKITVEDVRESLTKLFEVTYGGYEKTSNRVDANQSVVGVNPFLLNSKLKTLTSVPTNYSPEEIDRFLKQPQNNEEALRAAGISFSADQYLYYKILREAGDIPLFKRFLVPPVLEKEEYKKKEFLEEEEFVLEWLDKFDLTNLLKRTAIEVKREGKATYVLSQKIKRSGGKKRVSYATWMKLPSKHVKLTGVGEFGYIASFNLMVFTDPSYLPEQYPDFISKIWYELAEQGAVKKDKKTKAYTFDHALLAKHSQSLKGSLLEIDSSTDIGKRIVQRQGSCKYWVQLPQDLCYTFASDTSHAWAVPDTIGLFTALQELKDYSALAGLLASSPLTAVLTGQAEMVKEPRPGQDQTAIAPNTMLMFQNVFNSMVSNNVQAFIAPFKDLKLQSLPSVPNSTEIKTKAVQNFISLAGEGGLIAATDKPSISMIKGSQLLTASQYNFVTQQFQTVLNMILNTHTDVKHLWRIVFWGDIYSFDSEVKVTKEMVASGATFLLPKLVSAYDMSMRDVRAIGSYTDAFDIYRNFKTLGWASNKGEVVDPIEGTETSPVGRPVLDDSEVENDNTAISKDAGNNVSDIKDFARSGVCVFCGSEDVEDGSVLCENCEEELEIGKEE